MYHETSKIGASNNSFSSKMYEVLSRNQGNVFFSPLSVHAVLSMAFQGASGATSEAFAQTLMLPDAKTAANDYKDIMSHLNSLENVTLSMANKIYVKDDVKLQEKFKQVVTKYFQSEVDNIDFTNERAAEIINDWVRKKTHNKIMEVVQKGDLSEATCLLLLNAIYFKGSWRQPFDRALTKSEPFYLNDTDSIEVEMMQTKKKFYYNNDEELDAQILELPYQSGTSMYIILPNDRNGIASLEEKLVGRDLLDIFRKTYKTEVTVSLPKFKVEQTIDLQDVLTEMGLGVIFVPQKADFPGLIESEQKLVVSKVLQKAFIEINEEGAEAGAATCLVHLTKCYLPTASPPEIFRADHPFICIVVTTNDHIFFVGRISNFS